MRGVCQISQLLVLVISLWLWIPGIADASPLAERLASFPNWHEPPPLAQAKGDLGYPTWFQGNWQVTSTLNEQIAPLQPEIVSPGFAQNRRWLNQPVTFPIRFITTPTKAVVADRAFNGLSLARAYLGEAAVKVVKLDPKSVNRQITLLQSACPEQKICERQLVTLITQRRTETPTNSEFISSELYQQEFIGPNQPYFNIVENTTDYSYSPEATVPITADQITAIYLSPQDPQYFQAKDQPVAIYRYHLEFTPITPVS
jgi:hypothetical protein